jgi:hypothetical protein
MTDRTNSGHRQRLRDRFLAGEAAARSDLALLELLLAYAIPRKDVRPLAEALIRAFGDLSGVLTASQDELGVVSGVGPSAIALLKAVDQIRTHGPTISQPGVVSVRSARADVGAMQPFLFEDAAGSEDGAGAPEPPQEEALPVEADSEDDAVAEIVAETAPVDHAPEPSPEAEGPKAVSPQHSLPTRKLQVSRSRLLEFSRLSQILSLLYQHRDLAKISRKRLAEETGLPDSQVESLISVGAAMGLIQSPQQTLTLEGLLVAEHDVFLEQQGTLEWCHYRGAGSYKNLIWFDAFNHLLPGASAMTEPEWQAHFEEALSGQYSDETIKRHVYQEIAFVLDLYLEGNFKRLDLFQRASDGRLYCRRYTRFVPTVLAAMVYDFCAAQGGTVTQVGELATAPGSPAVVFGLDTDTFRAQIEALHDRGWLRYETTHDLDQIRLKPGLSAMAFLVAYYEDAAPQADRPV